MIYHQVIKKLSLLKEWEDTLLYSMKNLMRLLRHCSARVGQLLQNTLLVSRYHSYLALQKINKKNALVNSQNCCYDFYSTRVYFHLIGPFHLSETIALMMLCHQDYTRKAICFISCSNSLKLQDHVSTCLNFPLNVLLTYNWCEHNSGTHLAQNLLHFFIQNCTCPVKWNIYCYCC